MTNDQQSHPSSKANNHFTCGACSSGCGWDCAAAPEGRRNFLVSRACCTVYCNLPGCCFHLRIGAKKTHPGSMGGGEMPLRKLAASLAENPGFSCDCALAVVLLAVPAGQERPKARLPADSSRSHGPRLPRRWHMPSRGRALWNAGGTGDLKSFGNRNYWEFRAGIFSVGNH